MRFNVDRVVSWIRDKRRPPASAQFIDGTPEHALAVVIESEFKQDAALLVRAQNLLAEAGAIISAWHTEAPPSETMVWKLAKLHDEAKRTIPV